LTQSELNVSIRLPLMNTFGSLARLWMRRRSLGVMSTTWTKRDVSGVVVDECRLLNTSFHALTDHTISCKVPIWNWLQSLSVSVR
jgi:hypothetical protein